MTSPAISPASVKRYGVGLRWTLDVSTASGDQFVAHVDSTLEGVVRDHLGRPLGLQASDRTDVGTLGDHELDDAALRCVEQFCAFRRVQSEFDAATQRPYSRMGGRR